MVFTDRWSLLKQVPLQLSESDAPEVHVFRIGGMRDPTGPHQVEIPVGFCSSTDFNWTLS